ncbi:MAG TPA: glycosyltransferase, partial [Candidatus Limnocylindria bacterium]|nr:glycosyltransferase [Candidatus Limnocylindria bacterium]
SMPARISIFTPVFNDATWLPGAIESVLAQTYPHWEMVIGDNVSTDDVESIVRGYDDERIRYHRWETHVRIDENFNRTAGLGRFEWVQLLCADDRLRPRCLEEIAAAIDAWPADAERPSMVLTACRRVDEQGQSADHIWYGSKRPLPVSPGVHDPASWFNVLLGDGNPPWNVGSVAIARWVLDESGGFFRPEIGLSADVELSFRASAYGPVVYIDEPLLDFTVRADADNSVRLRKNRSGDDERTPVEIAMLAGLSVHRHRRTVTRRERRAVHAAIARSHLQRAAQHRVLEGGRGRAGALHDVVAAWRWSPATAISPYNLAYAVAALLAPSALLRRAQRRLAGRHGRAVTATSR